MRLSYFLAGATLLVFLLAVLWRESASAQQIYNSAPSSMLIATQALSSSSTGFQFKNVPNNYNSLFMNCGGLLFSATGASLILRIGEGSGGSFAWETGANYTSAVNSTTTATDVFDGLPWALSASTTSPVYVQAYVNNPSSSSLHKIVSGTMGGASNTVSYGYGPAVFTGWWNNDTNAVTGIELAPTGANITGTCSLYGMY